LFRFLRAVYGQGDTPFSAGDPGDGLPNRSLRFPPRRPPYDLLLPVLLRTARAPTVAALFCSFPPAFAISGQERFFSLGQRLTRLDGDFLILGFFVHWFPCDLPPPLLSCLLFDFLLI